METNVKVDQTWNVRIPQREDTFKAKVVFIGPNMVGLKEGDFFPQYYTPEEIEWVEKCE